MNKFLERYTLLKFTQKKKKYDINRPITCKDNESVI